MPAFDKIVVVTQPTALEELLVRYNTRDQAKFYLEHMGVSFAEYQAAHDTYTLALARLKRALPAGIRYQFIDRSFLPNYLFGPDDLVVTLGRDGLVVNTAKYLVGQPLVGINPDPARNDGVLLPFTLDDVEGLFPRMLAANYGVEQVTMAEASLNTGQTLYAVNDLFLGARTHTSARYRIAHGHAAEDQSSSGIIISTGAGSTGWFRSLLAGAAGIVDGFLTPSEQTEQLRSTYRFERTAPLLYYCVREPFASKTSAASLVFGQLGAGDELVVTSQMPRAGVIFSDGIEADGLEFTSGTVVRVRIADRTLRLVTAED